MTIKRIEGLPDYKAIIDLISAEWPPEFGEATDEEMVAAMIRSHDRENDVVKYLYDEETIIGFYRYTRFQSPDGPANAAHTLDIAVLPARQKQGLGRCLMKDMITDCRNRDYRVLLSRSFKNNSASIKLHQRCGFIRHLETEDSLVWELSL